MTMTTEERNEFLLANDGLAWKVAMKLWNWRMIRNMGSFDDCLQEARVALMRAADAYDPSRGWRFSTFAWKVLRTRIVEAADNGKLLRVPRATRMTYSKGGLSSKRAETARQVKQAGRLQGLPSHFDEALEHERDGVTPPWREIKRALRQLSGEHQDIIHMRFKLGMTQRQVGKILGVCHETIRLRERVALAQLREILSPAEEVA